MKTTLIVFFLLMSLNPFQTGRADQITGIWTNENGDAKFEILKKDGTYIAKISWLKNPENADGEEKKDKNNPDKSMRKRPVIGINIITGLQFDNNKYVNGQIYSPEKGITANCSAILVNNNLELTITKSFFTSHQTWKKL